MRHSPVIALLIAFFLAGCQARSPSAAPEPLNALPDNLVECPEKRPEVCTQQYDPVCGYATPGVPLGDGQSSGQEWADREAVEPNPHRTFGNACSACGKPDVVGYVPGACAE